MSGLNEIQLAAALAEQIYHRNESKRSLDKQSDIRGLSVRVPHVAPLMRATWFSAAKLGLPTGR
jgi:hypothetical protein